MPMTVPADELLPLFDGLPDVVFFIKDASGRYTHANATLIRRLGLKRREEVIGNMASKIAVCQPLRAALLQRQRDFAQAPGLIADGRDMGSVVFPNAPVKIFLNADAKVRAERRHKQLIEKGFSANMEDLLADLQARDARDMSRAHAPLKPAEGAYVLDSSGLTLDETVQAVLDICANKMGLSVD